MPQAAWRVYALRSGRAELYRDSFFILMVALPDGPAVPAVRVPRPGAVPSPAVPAFYPAGEDTRAACTVLPGMPGRHLVLRPLEHGRADDGLVVVLHIILRHLALIHWGSSASASAASRTFPSPKAPPYQND